MKNERYCTKHPDVVISREHTLGGIQYYPCFMCNEQEAMADITTLRKENENEQDSCTNGSV